MRKFIFPLIAVLLLLTIGLLSRAPIQPISAPPAANPSALKADQAATSGMTSKDAGGPATGVASQPTATPPAPTAAARPASPVTGNQSPGEPALKQIEALQAAKGRRTPAQLKLDSQLIDAERLRRGERIADGVETVAVDLDTDSAGRVLVDIDATVSDELLRGIADLDGAVINHFAQHDAVRARLPLPQIEGFAARADVKFVRPAVKASTHVGSVTSEGDATHRANAARANFSVTGAGVKVAVLSDSVDHLATAQASGDLGAVTVLPNQSGVPGSGEGTAMLEIVHDLAPGAELYFASAFNGPASFAENIRSLRFQYGCDIIVDDVLYSNESPFQDGIIARAVNDVTADGALFFSSASNSGNKSDGESGTWEGDFLDGGSFSVGGQSAGRLHSFGATTYNTVTPGGSQRHVVLFWADPLGAAANDYDVYVLDSTGNNVVAKADTTQDGRQDPHEFISKLEVGQRIVIVRYAGAGRYLHLGTGRARLAISTSGNTHGHNSAVDAFCVAAVDANTSYPDPFTGNAKNPVERFSSDGVRRVFYQADGSAITPGNFSSTGGAVRQKPDIAAADGVKTTLPPDSGLNPFFGTSAAAPHAGAVAALLKSYNPALSPAQVRAILTGTALDIESPGVDRDSGAGLVMALAALQAVPGPEQPTIGGVNPGSGGVGTAVTVTGTKLNGASAVKFNGVNAAFTVNSATQISATVPAGATTGRVTVTTPSGTATSPADFSVLATPAITGFVPDQGAAGTVVMVTGVHLTGVTAVQFNGVNAPTFAATPPSQVNVTVPAGATSGRISVVAAAGTATSGDVFTVTLAPAISGFAPVVGPVGSTVTLTGANLTGTTAVRLGGVAAPAFSVNSATRITVTVPPGAVSGTLEVMTPNGIATSADVFIVAGVPAITTFSPGSGAVGTAVTVSGTNFVGATAVTFGGSPASFAVNSATGITATVPAGAATGSIQVTTPGGTATSATAFTVLAPGSNDNFANAQTITGAGGSISDNSSAATKEVGEPDHADNPGGKSIWFRWTAPAAGTWTFGTLGSDFDTLLSVYTGNGVENLTLVASNDDLPGGTNSSLNFVAAAGTVYQVAVDGFRSQGGTAANAASGNVSLNWAGTTVAPAISGFSPSSGPVGTSVVITGANLSGATAVTFNGVAAAVTASLPTQITAIVPTGAGTGPIGVVTPGGVAVSAGNFAAVTPPANDNFADAPAIVGNSGFLAGSNRDATKEPGEADHAGNGGGRSVWYTWTAPGSGVWTFDTLGSGFDTLLAVYTGGGVGALTLVAANDDSSPGTISRAAFNAAAGTVYRIAIDGRNGSSGSLALNWAFTPNLPVVTGFAPTNGAAGSSVVIGGANFGGATAVRFNGVDAAFTVNSVSQITATVPVGANTGLISVTTPDGTALSSGRFGVSDGPANDLFLSAQTLAGVATIVAGQNVAASKEAGEPAHANDTGGRSVWYRWVAPTNGTWVLDTAGSGFDTTLAVYTGTGVTGLTEVASDDDARIDRSSRVSFAATAGTVYQIVVDGYQGDNGNLVLKLFPTIGSQLIYSTGFEAAEGFSTTLPLAGQGGWIQQGSGGNGIVDGIFLNQGQQAYLGIVPPSPADGVLDVWWPANFTPETNTRPVIRFSVLMAIADSLNSEYDDFFWSVYNTAGRRLFSLDFDNNDLNIYHLPNDGSGYQLTGASFLNDTINELVVTLDFARNRWSATFNGGPVVDEVPISATNSVARNLGDIDAVWVPRNAFAPGDNALVFDNYRISAEPSELPAIVRAPGDQTVVAGGNATLSVVASGGEPLQYQWRFNGVPVPGATNAIHALNNVNSGQAGNYSVVVSNPAGSIVGSGVLAVTQPVPATLISGSLLPDGQFQFTVTGTAGARTLVEFSADLSQWQELATVVIAPGGVVVADPQAGTVARRFYRARFQP